MRFLTVVATFVAGLVGGFLAVIALYLVWTELLGGHEREGAVAMGMFFVFGPILGLVIGIAAAAVAWRRTSRAPEASAVSAAERP